MSSSGLQQVLETVYAENTVPYMLAVLHTIIGSEIYNSQIQLSDQEEKSPQENTFQIVPDSSLADVSQLFDLLVAGKISIEERQKSFVYPN